MAFDPSTIGAISESMANPAKAKADAYKLSDLANMDQLNRLQLKGMETEQADAAKAKGIYAKSDISTPEGATKAAAELSRAGLPRQASDLIKASQERQSGDLKLKIEQLQLGAQVMDVVGSAVYPIEAKLEQARQQGATPAMLDAMAKQLAIPIVQQLGQHPMPEVQKTVQEWMKDPNSLTYNGIKTAAMHSKTGQEGIKQQLEQFTAETSRKREEETIRHDRATEEAANRRIDATSGGFEGRAGTLMAALAEKGISLPAGLRSKAQQQAMLQGLVSRNPDKTDDQIANMVRGGQIDMKATTTQANVVARREGSSAAAIEALNQDGGLYDQLTETAKKVDFGSVKFDNALRLWKQGQAIADPDIADYVNALADTRAEFASVLARGGQVTDSVRIAAEHAFPEKMSLQELERATARSKKIADSIQSGNKRVADRLIKGEDINTVAANPDTEDTPKGTTKLPEGVTEDDITETMRIRGMTREQVMAKLQSRAR